MSRTPCQIYLITPPAISDVQAFARQLSEALESGEVGALQIRLKDVNDERISTITRVIAPLAQAKGVAVLMNDYAHLVKPLGLDGVHLGQSDMPLKAARAMLGRDAMIGVTCHNSRHLAMEAAENSADYVAFGAFFVTTTKAVEHMAELETLSIWQESMEIPCVAIGGITAANAPEVVRAGADFVAVSAYVWTHAEGPAAAIEALAAAIG